MLAHLFKLIWNKKKQNFLLMLEMLVSFIILFAVFTMLIYYYQNYRRPHGFDYVNVWSVKYADPEEMHATDSIAAFNAAVKKMIESNLQVEKVSFSSINTPFGDASLGSSAEYKKVQVDAEMYTVDDDYKKVLDLQLIAGRWFSVEDNATTRKSLVINESMSRALFGNVNGLGKIIDFQGQGKIVGIIRDVKDKGDFSTPHRGIYQRIDTANQGNGGSILIKVKPGTSAVVESHLYKELSNMFKGTSIDILHLENQRQGKITEAIGPLIVLLVVAGFLIINVALGLFGVLWYNINKRKSEIGLRRAVGASGFSISKQLVWESLVLATFALIVGSFFAVQFPLLNVFDLPAGTYLLAIVFAILSIYLLVIICAVYPGKQAASIYPAIALHED